MAFAFRGDVLSDGVRIGDDTARLLPGAGEVAAGPGRDDVGRRPAGVGDRAGKGLVPRSSGAVEGGGLAVVGRTVVVNGACELGRRR